MKTTLKHLFLAAVLLFCIKINANTDKYRLVLTDDPATTMTIAWNQINGTNATVYYGSEDFDTNSSSYPKHQSVDKTINFKGMINSFVYLTGLKPNTNYYFIIKDDNSTSKRFWFKTAPNDLSRLSFIAGGDSRNNRTPRRNANKLVAKLKPQAVFFGGDMTFSDTSTQWQNWFDDWQLTTAQDGRMFPIVPTRGNHDNKLTVYKLFGLASQNEYYALTFGDNLLRSYTLNTEIATNGDQKNWLQQDLAQYQKCIWKMAQYHKPMRPHHASKSEGHAVYSSWANLFYEYGSSSGRVRLSYL